MSKHFKYTLLVFNLLSCLTRLHVPSTSGLRSKNPDYAHPLSPLIIPRATKRTNVRSAHYLPIFWVLYELMISLIILVAWISSFLPRFITFLCFETSPSINNFLIFMWRLMTCRLRQRTELSPLNRHSICYDQKVIGNHRHEATCKKSYFWYIKLNVNIFIMKWFPEFYVASIHPHVRHLDTCQLSPL